MIVFKSALKALLVKSEPSIANLSSKRKEAPDSDDLVIEEFSQEETDTDLDMTKTSDAFEYIGKSVYSVTGRVARNYLPTVLRMLHSLIYITGMAIWI